MRFEAFAKINLGLVVHPSRGERHPIDALNLSVSWADELMVEVADADELDVQGPVPTGHSNLAWQALTAVRPQGGSPVHLSLRKGIPAAAGLGGGSADAAAALAAAGEVFGIADESLLAAAAALGSDIPFCLVGGLAVVGGTGELVTPLPPVDGFACAIVVPPFDLSTADVYRAWDEADHPVGPVLDAVHLPPPLRSYAPLRNDLYPAAVGLRPEIEDWRSELEGRWARRIVLTGSGPSLYAFFVDRDEAESAVLEAPPGLRGAKAVTPMPSGWKRLPE
jgi:4-diphosphocytidyl-2-C-methyl-D-erythritol kinase